MDKVYSKQKKENKINIPVNRMKKVSVHKNLFCSLNLCGAISFITYKSSRPRVRSGKVKVGRLVQNDYRLESDHRVEE